MKCNNFRLAFYVSSIAFSLALTSCQKDADPPETDPIPGQVTDSTLLIKNITLIGFKGSPDERSITEHYSYDTVNRKIVLTWSAPPAVGELVYPAGTSAELSYTSKGLLARVEYKYPLGYVPGEEDPATTDITYDAADVLQKIVHTSGDGTVKETLFQKTTLTAGGYRLTWQHIMNIPTADKLTHEARFNANGKNITSTLIYESSFVNDSIVYDASGNVTKLFKNKVNTSNGYNESYVALDFTARQTKGDQLYYQRLALMNGLADIPFEDFDDSMGDIFGSIILSYSDTQKRNLQYSKFPFLSVKVALYDGSYKDFSSVPVLDSKDRLISFTGCSVDESVPQLETFEYKLSYYK